MESAPGSPRQREGPRPHRRRAATSDGEASAWTCPRTELDMDSPRITTSCLKENPSSAASLLQRFEPGQIHAMRRRLARDAAGRHVQGDPLCEDSGCGQALLTEWQYRNFDRASDQQVGSVA